MAERFDKDETIVQVISKLRERLGDGIFDVVDPWEDDLCAVGIARPDDHGVLVYVNTYGCPEFPYYVSLELPPAQGDESWANHPYTPTGDYEAHNFGELVAIVRKHLGPWPSQHGSGIASSQRN